MFVYSKLSVDEYIVNGYEIAIDGYSKTLINGYQILVLTDLCM